jgi:hypothetical protein
MKDPGQSRRGSGNDCHIETEEETAKGTHRRAPDYVSIDFHMHLGHSMMLKFNCFRSAKWRLTKTYGRNNLSAKPPSNVGLLRT